jgi:hypothetical protein
MQVLWQRNNKLYEDKALDERLESAHKTKDLSDARLLIQNNITAVLDELSGYDDNCRYYLVNYLINNPNKSISLYTVDNEFQDLEQDGYDISKYLCIFNQEKVVQCIKRYGKCMDKGEKRFAICLSTDYYKVVLTDNIENKLKEVEIARRGSADLIRFSKIWLSLKDYLEIHPELLDDSVVSTKESEQHILEILDSCMKTIEALKSYNRKLKLAGRMPLDLSICINKYSGEPCIIVDMSGLNKIEFTEGFRYNLGNLNNGNVVIVGNIDLSISNQVQCIDLKGVDLTIQNEKFIARLMQLKYPTLKQLFNITYTDLKPAIKKLGLNN